MELKGKAFGAVRDCVDFVNKHKIQKEDIVSILPFEGMIFLIYFKRNDRV